MIKKLLRLLWAFLPCVMLLLLTVTLIFTVKLVVTQGPSMEPTYTTGDLVLCTRAFASPQKGDVIVFSKDGVLLIKRVYAVAGETVVVGGQAVSYWEESFPGCGGTVPRGYLFVCGDNSAASYDSRDPQFGLVPVSSVWGYAAIRLFHSKYI